MNNSIMSASGTRTQTFSIKKTALAGMLIALTVALSGFSIPIGASKCFPIQHLVNVLAGIFLGPVYGVSMAFCVSLIRNILGTGSLLAFPGSMAGAFLGAYLFKKSGRFIFAYLGEVVGTGLIGGTLCCPVAVFLMGKEATLFLYVIPFLMSTACGTAIAFMLIEFTRHSGLFSWMNNLLNTN